MLLSGYYNIDTIYPTVFILHSDYLYFRLISKLTYTCNLVKQRIYCMLSLIDIQISLSIRLTYKIYLLTY